MPLPISAFKILYLSPLKVKKAPGEGNKPFILQIIFVASILQSILLYSLFIFFTLYFLESLPKQACMYDIPPPTFSG